MKSIGVHIFLLVCLILLTVKSTNSNNKLIDVLYASDNCIHSCQLNEYFEHTKPCEKLYCSKTKAFSSVDFNRTKNILIWCENEELKYSYGSFQNDGKVNEREVKTITNISCDRIAYDHKDHRIFYSHYSQSFNKWQISVTEVEEPRKNYVIINATEGIVDDIKLDRNREVLVWLHKNFDGTGAEFMISNLNGTNSKVLAISDEKHLKMPQFFDIDLEKGIVYFIDTFYKKLVSLTYLGHMKIIINSGTEFERNSIDSMAFCNAHFWFHKLNASNVIVATTAEDITEMDYIEIRQWYSRISALKCAVHHSEQYSQTDQSAFNLTILFNTLTTIPAFNNITSIVTNNTQYNLFVSNNNGTFVGIIVFLLFVILILSCIIAKKYRRKNNNRRNGELVMVFVQQPEELKQLTDDTKQ